jgi:hypothetical protein
MNRRDLFRSLFGAAAAAALPSSLPALRDEFSRAPEPVPGKWSTPTSGAYEIGSARLVADSAPCEYLRITRGSDGEVRRYKRVGSEFVRIFESSDGSGWRELR